MADVFELPTPSQTPQQSTFTKPLAWAPDTDDLQLHQQNCCPELATRRLHELVPLLAFIECAVTEVGPDRTVLSLPLNVSAMNQNGTHQAAVFYLVADYTLGVGMFGVLPGVYVTGVHDRCHALPVQYWLKRGSVHHLAPGTGPMRAEVCISSEKAANLRRQLIERGRGELTDTVRFYQEGQLVAEAEHTMGMYADVPRTVGVRANLFQVQNLKTSALMIAGLRDDPISNRVAGDQGRAIAQRMSLVAPQLPTLVQARSSHVEQLLHAFGASFSQIVVLGVGLDPKPCRLAKNGQKWFGVDLREMLREREKRFSGIAAPSTDFIAVAADLRLDSWAQQLLTAGFLPTLPALFILEGVSMYLTESELKTLLQKVHALAHSIESRVWIDHVTTRIFASPVNEVRAFLSSMTRLGEPFINGFDDSDTLDPTLWETVDSKSAAAVLAMEDDVHREYRFAVLRPKA